MTAAKILLVALGAVVVLVVDIGAVVRLVMPSAPSIAGLLGIHALCALAAGWVLCGMAPSFLQARRPAVGLFVSCIAFFVPVLGVLGVILMFSFGLSEPRPACREPWVMHDAVAELDAERRKTVKAVQRRISASEIGAVLRRRAPEHASERFRAVLATRYLPANIAVPLLTLAQRDPSDEVRLYAFSRLESMRSEIEKRIEQLRGSVAADGAHALLHLRLAESHWELGASGLTEGAVRGHALTSACRHVRAACELAPGHAAAEFFRGRVLLMLREPDAGAAALEAALRAGYPRSKLLFHIAECAFQRRDFATVRSLLSELERSRQESVLVRDLIALWTQSEPTRPAHRSPSDLAENTL